MIIGKRALGGFPTIHIYTRGPGYKRRYLASTNSARTLKEAKERYAATSKSYDIEDLRAEYA